MLFSFTVFLYCCYQAWRNECHLLYKLQKWAGLILIASVVEGLWNYNSVVNGVMFPSHVTCKKKKKKKKMQFALQSVIYSFCNDGVVYPGLVYENKVSNSVGWDCDFSNHGCWVLNSRLDLPCFLHVH